MKYRRKKIFVTQDKTKYVWCYLFENNKEMNLVYKEMCKQMGKRYNRVLGVSVHSTYKYLSNNKVHPLTGSVLLSKQHLGAALVAHEFTHACLWAFKHHKNKKQYPLVIKNMAEEETLCQNQSVAIKMFWNWYYKIEKE